MAIRRGISGERTFPTSPSSGAARNRKPGDVRRSKKPGDVRRSKKPGADTLRAAADWLRLALIAGSHAKDALPAGGQPRCYPKDEKIRTKFINNGWPTRMLSER